ncbi:hypothetical protein [Streptomyces violarus]|uniref:hypothetical protein n=1 Tax=Streptomyces violarus TaxID=67380 RepID=UPI0021BFF0EE|nr:hypothetical protein [Streptomyces violarus]MCT9142420.1 hypothetical protein [Streptomyces violarus]
MPKSEAEKAAEAKRVEKAQERLAAAKKKRDEAKAAADREFWSAVAAAIDSGDLRQTEACEAIGYKREYVRRQLLELRAQATESTD